MAKKDFSSISTGRVYQAIDEATQEAPKKESSIVNTKIYTREEAVKFLEDMKTSGRKGLKLPRINMAFTPQIYDYCKTMAQVSGISVTAFINLALDTHLQQHKDIYEKALEFRNSI